MTSRVTLFCVPHAGGGASAYRGWAEALAPDIVVKVLQLRGRESRFRESPLTELGDVLEDLYGALEAGTAQEFALFGHSMGALLAFELAHLLRRRTGRVPTHLFVSACRAPQLPQVSAAISGLPQAEFVAELTRRYGGIPAAILADNDYLAAILPSIRADFGILERYRLSDRPHLPCPISAFGGQHDTIAPQPAIMGWMRQTSGAFILEMLDGEHFYLQTQRLVMAELISCALKSMEWIRV